MHLPINVKSPNNISKWQMGINSAFKGLIAVCLFILHDEEVAGSSQTSGHIYQTAQCYNSEDTGLRYIAHRIEDRTYHIGSIG
jgi:hypothetical protein